MSVRRRQQGSGTAMETPAVSVLRCGPARVVPEPCWRRHCCRGGAAGPAWPAGWRWIEGSTGDGGHLVGRGSRAGRRRPRLVLGWAPGLRLVWLDRPSSVVGCVDGCGVATGCSPGVAAGLDLAPTRPWCCVGALPGNRWALTGLAPSTTYFLRGTLPRRLAARRSGYQHRVVLMTRN